MHAVILTGIQASGKTTFYRERFFDTHVRISLDMLRTRNRERILLRACLDAKQPFVIDNTNVLAAERARYIVPSRELRFRVTGYYFQPELERTLGRNKQRRDKAPIPIAGVMGTWKRLQPPSLTEGYDELFTVTLGPDNQFVVSPANPTM
jgi:predicted kinase